MSKTYRVIFSIQDEPPSWSDSEDIGLESLSEPDVDLDSNSSHQHELSAEGSDLQNPSSSSSVEAVEAGTGAGAPLTSSGGDIKEQG